MADIRDPYLRTIGELMLALHGLDAALRWSDVAKSEPTSPSGREFLRTLCALDAVADLLRDHARTRVRHNREMREEQREAQRGARDAYVEGRFEGRGDEFWP